MSSGVTSERVYEALKALLLSGEIVPGERLEPVRFASDLASSVTPVRDALNRLVGERIVEMRTSDGFHLPLVSEPALHDLYAWNGQLLHLAVRSWPAGPAVVRADALPAGAVAAMRVLFDRFALRSGKVELQAQIASASDRLGAARMAELTVLDGIEAEMQALALAFDNETPTALLKLLGGWERRRLRAMPAIVRALYHR